MDLARDNRSRGDSCSFALRPDRGRFGRLLRRAGPPAALPGDGASRVAANGASAVEPSRRSPTTRRRSRSWRQHLALALGSDAGVSAILQRELAEQGHPFKLINAGVSGDTSAAACGASSGCSAQAGMWS